MRLITSKDINYFLIDLRVLCMCAWYVDLVAYIHNNIFLLFFFKSKFWVILWKIIEWSNCLRLYTLIQEFKILDLSYLYQYHFKDKTKDSYHEYVAELTIGAQVGKGWCHIPGLWPCGLLSFQRKPSQLIFLPDLHLPVSETKCFTGVWIMKALSILYKTNGNLLGNHCFQP